MSRHGFHTFTMPDAPVFGLEDPFFDDLEPADRAATLNPHAAKALASVPFEGRAPELNKVGRCGSAAALPPSGLSQQVVSGLRPAPANARKGK